MNVYVRLRGGLGNQFFQYSFALMILKKYKADKLILDTRSYKNYKIRNFELLNFELNENVEIIDSFKIKLLIPDIIRLFYHCLSSIYQRIFKKNYNNKLIFLHRFGYFYTKEFIGNLPKTMKKDIFLFGYFIDEHSIKLIKEDLKSNFKCLKMSDNSKKFLNLIDEKSLAISIRCGNDFKKIGWDYCNIDYYQNGLNKLEGKYDKIFIFSDDISKASKYIKISPNIKVYYIENCNPSEQIELLKKFKLFIISNSTFSWWGAYLSDYDDKIVVLPERWTDIIYTEKSRIYYANCLIVK